jgi:hypothetical protein
MMRHDRHFVSGSASVHRSDVIRMLVRQHNGRERFARLFLLSIQGIEETLLFMRIARSWVDQINRIRSDKISVRVRARRQTVAKQRQHQHAGIEPDRRDFVPRQSVKKRLSAARQFLYRKAANRLQ